MRELGAEIVPVATFNGKGGERYTMCTGTHDFISVENVAEARMQYSTPGGFAENVFHFAKGSEWDIDALQALGAFIVAIYDGQIQSLQGAGVTFNRILLKNLGHSTGPSIEYTDGLPLTGTHASPNLPDNVTLSIKKTGLLSGRSFRGRFYFIGAVEGGVGGDTFNGAYADDIIEAYTALVSFNLDGDPVKMVVVSYCSEGAWREAGVYTNVLTLSTDYIVDSMRKRLPGRGI
jgi:hypothetical protein